MKCDRCLHLKWIIWNNHKANWTILGCTLKKLRFGQEKDKPWDKSDKDRGFVAMPKKCAEKVKYDPK